MSAHKFTVRLTSQAERDLEDILLYTAEVWGDQQAAAYRQQNLMGLDGLRSHPQIGRTRQDVFPGCRSLQVEQHIIYYHQPDAAGISLLRILHRRRDMGEPMPI